jgi:hypothetical protein
MESTSAKKYTKRIISEENLLNMHTSVFLVTCGILLATFGISDNAAIRLIVSVVGILTTIFWIIISGQRFNVIGNLTREYRKDHKEDEIEDIVQASVLKARWLRPAFILARMLPFTFLTAWIVLFILHLLKLVRLLILF